MATNLKQLSELLNLLNRACNSIDSVSEQIADLLLETRHDRICGS